MRQDFEARFFFHLLHYWRVFLEQIPSSSITSFMKTFTEQMNRKKEFKIKIDAFVINWNKIAKTFPDVILPFTHKIEALLQIWADYHQLELKLEDMNI
jgi:hypothetical protein